jgi:hypothetical protein
VTITAYKTTWATLGVLLAGLAIPATSPGRGGDDSRREIRRAGDCTGNSRSKIKLKERDGRLEAEFEVDQNRNGVRWRVTLRHQGRVVSTRTAVTRAPSGSFSVERRIADRAGRDRVTFTARRRGERCTASASI